VIDARQLLKNRESAETVAKIFSFVQISLMTGSGRLIAELLMVLKRKNRKSAKTNILCNRYWRWYRYNLNASYSEELN